MRSMTTIAAALIVLAAWTPAIAAPIFREPVNLGAALNSPYEEGAPSITADGHTLFFQSSRPGGDGSFSIWQSTRQSLSEPFGTPVVVTATNSPAADFSPGISADGLTLFFISTRDDSRRQGNIWQTTRASVDEPFGTPTRVGGVGSTSDDTSPRPSADGLTLYFGSLRSGGQGNYDLWQATRPTNVDQFANPTNLGSTVNSSANDGQPTITSDGLTLYFGSKRSGGVGSRSIWSTTRSTVDDPFGAPINLGPVVNSDGSDAPGSVSRNGKTLYLSSDREGGLGSSDIWVTSTFITVPVDIIPGGGPNAINLNSNRNIPISILTTGEFDALDVDLDSLLFGDPLLIDAGFSAVGPTGSNYRDINHDGLLDLSLFFSVPEMVDNGVLGPLSVEGLLSGIMLDGTEIMGSDTLRIVPPFDRGLHGGAIADVAGAALVFDTTLTAVPEPSTFALAAMGLLGILVIARRRNVPCLSAPPPGDR